MGQGLEPIGMCLASLFLGPSTRSSNSAINLYPMASASGQSQKTLKILNVFEDSTNGTQVFQIHEQDPMYKIDRIVYREKSPYGWFKEISSEDYLRKVKNLRQIVY